MRILFLGTPEFALPALEALLASRHEVVGVVTAPDRPQGRRLKVIPSPVKQRAIEAGLPVWQPTAFKRNDALFEELSAISSDVWVTAAYGLILPQRFLGLPRLDCLNIHPSLLPRYRGAAPIPWAILNGENTTGVTIMRMVARMDAGPVYLQREESIAPADTTATLEPRLARLGASLLLKTLTRIEDGTIEPTPQDDAQATLAPMLQKEDGRLDWTLSAEVLARRIRGLTPWPGAYSFLLGKRIRLCAAVPYAPLPGAEVRPGLVQGLRKNDGLVVGTGEGALLVRELQPEGRRPVQGDAFYQGIPVDRRAGLCFTDAS
jgi:methionyl-tRNA formyltransferase